MDWSDSKQGLQCWFSVRKGTLKRGLAPIFDYLTVGDTEDRTEACWKCITDQEATDLLEHRKFQCHIKMKLFSSIRTIRTGIQRGSGLFIMTDIQNWSEQCLSNIIWFKQNFVYSSLFHDSIHSSIPLFLPTSNQNKKPHKQQTCRA